MKKTVLFVIPTDYSFVKSEIQKELIPTQLQHPTVFYSSSKLALDGVIHNMPGGNYSVMYFGTPDLDSIQLFKKVKRIRKTNRVCVYTDCKPDNIVPFDRFIPKNNLSDDMKFIQSFLK